MEGNKQNSANRTVILVCLLAAIAGLMFGLDTGVISGAKQFVIKDFGLEGQLGLQGWLVAALTLGAAVGAVLAGWISFHIGRKYSLLCAAVIFICGSLLSAFSPNIEILIFARGFLGLAVGIASYATPLYLAEVAPERIRGSMISFYQLLITAGLLTAYLSDTYFSYWEAWRWMLGVVVFPAIVLFFGILFVPRSPRWLASKGRHEEARQVLRGIRPSEEAVQKELSDIEEGLQVKQNGWNLFKGNSNFRRSVGLGMLLQIMQQITGINIILYFAPEIIKMAGFASVEEQMWGSVLVGLINVLATFIAISVVDKWGRRPILFTGYAIMAASMAALALMMSKVSAGGTVSATHYLSLVMLALFIIGFAMSAGPLAWVLCSEIQPLRGRDFGVTVSTATNWVVNMILTVSFLSLIAALGQANTFWFYAALNLICIILIWRLVPETKGVTLEKIEANLMAGKRLRNIGENIDAPVKKPEAAMPL